MRQQVHISHKHTDKQAEHDLHASNIEWPWRYPPANNISYVVASESNYTCENIGGDAGDVLFH